MVVWTDIVPSATNDYNTVKRCWISVSALLMTRDDILKTSFTELASAYVHISDCFLLYLSCLTDLTRSEKLTILTLSVLNKFFLVCFQYWICIYTGFAALRYEWVSTFIDIYLGNSTQPLNVDFSRLQHRAPRVDLRQKSTSALKELIS